MRASLAVLAVLALSAALVAAQEPAPKPTEVSTATLYSRVMPPVDPPDYPDEAKPAGVVGLVKVRVVVSENGQTTSVEAVDGPEPLREAAVDAVRSWTFVAYDLKGVPVTMTGVAVLGFRKDADGFVGYVADAKGKAVPKSAFGRIRGGVPH